MPDIDGSTRAHRGPAEKWLKDDGTDERGVDLPVRRIGLEQEFFLVDRTGALCDLADHFLRRCWEAAEAEGLDPGCFKPECVKSLVEITTPPSSGIEGLARNYLSNLNLALDVASELGLELYPLGTYPLAIRPEVRDDAGYRIQARTIGRDRFLHAGRGAGTHLHLEAAADKSWLDLNAVLDAPAAAQQELLGLYNLATALDPALVALTRACPFYEGRMSGFATRTVHYRGMLGLDGLYADLQDVGALSAYATSVEDFIEQQDERYRAWFAAMDAAGLNRRLFAATQGGLHRASWNPIRLSYHGTVEIRSMDANFPEVILAVCTLICGAVDRFRREHLRVRPSRRVCTLELDGDELLVPHFSYLSGELLGAAVTRGVLDERIEAYLDSLVRFASAYVDEPEFVESLRCSGSRYKTTEDEVLHTFPPLETILSREQGLQLVRRSCQRLREQVLCLRQRHQARQDGEMRTGRLTASLEATLQHCDTGEAVSNA
jgi:gamma-glutamyl:cysteine ligase YbdK (ATP-grasp superfamily)